MRAHPDFVAQWRIVSVINGLILAPISVFIGPNILVSVSRGYEGIPSDKLDSSILIGVFGRGFLVGLAEANLLKTKIPKVDKQSQFLTLTSFTIGNILGAAGWFLLSSGFYVALFPNILIGSLVWILGICAPLLVLRELRGSY